MVTVRLPSVGARGEAVGDGLASGALVPISGVKPVCYEFLLPPILFCCVGGRYSNLKYMDMEKRL